MIVSTLNLMFIYNIFIFRTKKTVGIFWQNAAETWVDIYGQNDPNVVSSIVNFVSGNGLYMFLTNSSFIF